MLCSSDKLNNAQGPMFVAREKITIINKLYMCKVSNKIKLCTCGVNSVSKLKHYWILHRYNKLKNNIIIGEFMLPYMIDEKILINNKAILLKRLNEADVFDVELFPKNKDRLQLTFTCPGADNQKITYGYSYKKGKWVEEDFDPLEWSWYHDQERFGTIKPNFCS